MFNSFVVAAASHAGKKRKASPNQDSVRIVWQDFFHHLPPLLIVADGMGGYTGGELASKLVVEKMKKVYLNQFLKLSPQELLDDAVKQAHQAIRVAGQKNQNLASMGSTVVAAVLHKDELSVLNVGDSRLYVFGEGQSIRQVSYDQSFVADKVRSGEITAQEAFVHPKKNQLTMSISARRESVTSVYASQSLESNDVILLCSDGLWGTVPESLIRAAACQLKPHLAVKKLIELANGFGGPDNISVIIARRKDSKYETVSEDNDDSLPADNSTGSYSYLEENHDRKDQS